MKKINLAAKVQLNIDKIDHFLNILNNKLKDIINNDVNDVSTNDVIMNDVNDVITLVENNTIIHNNNTMNNTLFDNNTIFENNTDKKILDDMNNYQNNKYSSSNYYSNKNKLEKKYSKHTKIFYNHIMKNDLVLISKLNDYVFYFDYDKKHLDFDYDKKHLDKNKIFIYSDGINSCNHVSYCSPCALLVYENLIKNNSLVMCIKCDKMYHKFILK